MIGLLRKLFGRSRGTDTRSDPALSAKAAKDVRPDEPLEDVYKEFCATVCFRPNTNLMEYLKANGHTDLINWFHWDTTEPEPKALIRLFVSTTRRGDALWEKKGLTLYHDGGWDITGGGPSQYTQDALSVLAKILQKSIKVGYTEKPDGPIIMMVFEP
jgi:hypothetical protein